MKKVGRSLLISAIISLVLSIEVGAWVNISGNITVDTFLGETSPATDGIYIVTGDITVYDGATLTIGEGVEIRFNQNRAMYIGTTTSPGTLVCQGIEANPVLITSNQTEHTRGYWYNIYFRQYSDASVLEHTTIEYGGGNYSTMIYLESSDVEFSHCELRESSNYGIRILGDSAPVLDYVQIHDCSSYGIRSQNTSSPTLSYSSSFDNSSYGIYADTTGTLSISSGDFSGNNGYGIYCSANTCMISIADSTFNDNTSVPLRLGSNRIGYTSGNSFSGNGNSYIECLGATVAEDAIWENYDIPYRITGEVYIRGQHGPDFLTKVTIEPGTIVEFTGTLGITVGHDSDPNQPGSISAIGAADEEIIFRRVGSGYWDGIYFSNFSDDFTCHLKYCILENGGYDIRSVYCNYANPIIEDSIITNAYSYGIYCYYSSPGILNCEISDCTSYGIYANESSPTITACDILNNGSHGIYLNGNESDPAISDCLIDSNAGYGIYCDDAGTGPVISDNTITNNIADYTIYIYATFCPDITGNALDKDIYVVSQTISKDAVWEGQDTAYYMSGGITVRGESGADSVTTLTLQEGTTIKLPSTARIYIGHDSNASYPGGFLCEGTESNPVLITSTSVSPSPGSWGDIYFAVYAEDALCQLDWTTIEYGGQYFSNAYHYPVHCNYSSPQLYNCTIRYSAYTGFYATYASPVIEGCTIVESGWYNIVFSNCNGSISDSIISDSGGGYAGIYLSGDCETMITDNIIGGNGGYGIYCNNATTAPYITGNSFVGNINNPIYVYARNVWKIGLPLNSYVYNGGLDRIYVVGDTVSLDSFWYDQLKPYYIAGDVTVQGTDGDDTVTTLEIEEGTELEFNSATGFFIGSNDVNYPGALLAQGTSGENIIFTGDVESVGYWDGIYFYDYADDSICLLEYCDLLYGGYSSFEGIYCTASSPTIRHSRILYSNGACVYAHNASNPVIDNCEIGYASGIGVYSRNGSNPQITFSNIHDNTSYGIYLYNGTELTISDSTISLNQSYGLYCNGAADVPLITNCSFTENNAYPIHIYAGNVRNISDCSYADNLYEFINVRGDTIVYDSYWEMNEPYYIEGDVYVQGQDGEEDITVLTIEAGSELHFNTQRGLYIGHDSNSTLTGGLQALGTDSARIIFGPRGSASPGYWDGIYFSRYSDDASCLMEYCNVLYGGYSGYENIYCYDSSPVFRHCIFNYNSGYGVYAHSNAAPVLENCYIGNSTSYGLYANTNADPSLINCMIHDNESYGIYVNNSSHVTLQDSTVTGNNWGLYCNGGYDSATVNGCTFSENSNYPVRMYASQTHGVTGCAYVDNDYQQFYVYGDTITKDSVWVDQGIPYYIHSAAHVFVQGKDGADQVTTWTIEPGAELMINSIYLWIGHDSNANYPGALVAEGTASEPVIFTSDMPNPAPGDWHGIYFAAHSDDAITSLQHCVIEYGGAGAAYENVQCYESSPVLSNCEISYGAGNGVRAYTNNARPTLTDCWIHDNTSSGVYAEPGTVSINGGVIENNPSYGIYIQEASAAMNHSLIDGAVIRYNSGYGIYAVGSTSMPEIVNCNIHSNNAAGSGYGIYITSSAQPLIGGSASNTNYFSDHISYAVYNATTSTCIDASYNFWGKEDGPLDTQFGLDDCVDTGNSNIGAERVSEDVYYLDWTDYSPTPVPTLTPTMMPTFTPMPTEPPTMVPTPEPTFTPEPCINDGDVNNDGEITSEDCQMTYMIVLGAYSPSYEEWCSADCMGDGQVTIGDAQCMHIFILGEDCECADAIAKGMFTGDQADEKLFGRYSKIDAPHAEVDSESIEPYGMPLDAVTEKSLDQAADVIWVNDAAGCVNEEITVEIMIRNANTEIDALGFSLEFDSEMLELTDWEVVEQDLQWIMFGCNELEPGYLKFAGFAYPDYIPAGENRTLALLKFKVLSADCRIGEQSALSLFDLKDDLTEFTAGAGRFTFCDLRFQKNGDELRFQSREHYLKETTTGYGLLD